MSLIINMPAQQDILFDFQPSMYQLATQWHAATTAANAAYGTAAWPQLAARAESLLSHCRITQRLTTNDDARTLMQSFITH